MLIRGVGLAKMGGNRWKDSAAMDEIAAVFLEAAPHLCSGNSSTTVSTPPCTPLSSRIPADGDGCPDTVVPPTVGRQSPGAGRLRRRLGACAPVPASSFDRVDWRQLKAVVKSEAVAEEGRAREAKGGFGHHAVDVNSGGAVFFCVLGRPEGGNAEGGNPGGVNAARRPTTETVLVLKFCANRLAAQSEYFAGEIAKALEVHAPATRLMRKAPAATSNGVNENTPPPRDDNAPGAEWAAVAHAADMCAKECAGLAGFEEDAEAAEALANCLRNHQAALVMEFVHGKPLHRACGTPGLVGVSGSEPGRESEPPRGAIRSVAGGGEGPFGNAGKANATVEALGRIFVLDALLGNADRLPCQRLHWRGNPGNLLYGRVSKSGASAGERADGREGGGVGAVDSNGRPVNGGFRPSHRRSSSLGGVGDQSAGEPPSALSSTTSPATSANERASEKQRPPKVVVAIDQAVPRRPPAMRARADAMEVPRVIELIRNHRPSAAAVLLEALGGEHALRGLGLTLSELEETLAPRFQTAVREAVEATGKLKGLFDSLAKALYETLRMLFADMDDMRKEEAAAKAIAASPEKKISPAKALREARRSQASGGDQSDATRAVHFSSPPRKIVPAKSLCFPGVGGGAMIPNTPVPSNGGGVAPIHYDLQRPTTSGGKDNTGDCGGLMAQPENRPENNATSVGDGGIETPGRGYTCKGPDSPMATQGTMRLRKVQRDAKGDEGVSEWLVDWEDVMREDKAQLKQRCGEWAKKRGLSGAMHTGFFDCTTGRDIVDCYELWVRLSHLTHRGDGIVAAGETAAPSLVAPRLYLGGALAANAKHTLKELGVTHILNCTDDLADAHPGEFTYGRVSAKDVTEEDLSAHFTSASQFISGAMLAPNAVVLVHCFEGKSRSATIVAQHLMETTKTSLKEVLAGLKSAHPCTKPNDGFMQLLMQRERELFGSQSVEHKSRRPEPRECPKCGAKCGLSAESVRVHIKKAHPGML